MRAWLFALLSAFCLTAPAQGQGPPPSPVRYGQPVIAITHVTLVDGTGAPALRDAAVVLRDGRIAAVGPSRRVRVPAGATLIDGTGRTLLPGFVFVHEHLFYPTGAGHFSPMLHSFPPLYLAGGVTTARTGGTVSPYADLNLRQAIASGSVVGPDLDVTGPYDDRRGPWPADPGAARPRRRRRDVTFRQLLGRRRRDLVQGLYDAAPRPAAARDRDRAPPRRPHHRPSLRGHLSRGGGDGHRQSRAWLRRDDRLRPRQEIGR